MKSMNIKSGLGLLLVAIALAGSGQANEEAAIKATVLKFIDGINTLDVEKVKETFSDDATVFYPFSFTPELLKGKAEIAEKQIQGFELIRAYFAKEGKEMPETLGLKPADFVIQLLTKDVAVVHWHSPRPTHLGRRTSVVQKIGNEWVMVAHHASNTN